VTDSPGSDHFDLVVIGAGPAGEKGAAQAAYFGKRVCIVERAPKPGGAMVNTGTIPSKTLRETATYFSGFRQRGVYGVDLRVKPGITVGDFMQRERNAAAAGCKAAFRVGASCSDVGVFPRRLVVHLCFHELTSFATRRAPTPGARMDAGTSPMVLTALRVSAKALTCLPASSAHCSHSSTVARLGRRDARGDEGSRAPSLGGSSDTVSGWPMTTSSDVFW
jgi:choline dehydrogenase-like flavoprotein